jgi:hypothetical protein
MVREQLYLQQAYASYVAQVSEWQAVLKAVKLPAGSLVRGTKKQWKEYVGDPYALACKSVRGRDEEARIQYVGVTRAHRNLFIGAPKEGPKMQRPRP